MKQNETNIHLSVKEVQFRKNPRFLHWRFLFYLEKITRKKTVLNLDASMKIEWFRKVCCITVFEKSGVSVEGGDPDAPFTHYSNRSRISPLANSMPMLICYIFCWFLNMTFFEVFFFIFVIKFWLNPFFFYTNVFNVAIQIERRKNDYLHNLQINMKIWIKIKREIL